MNRSRIGKAAGILVGLLAAGLAWEAAAMSISVTSALLPAKPGDEVTVSVVLDTNNFMLGYYRLPISYDREVLWLKKVDKGTSPEFNMPLSEDQQFSPYIYIWDDNNHTLGCTTLGVIILVNLTFKVLDTAPPGRDVSIQLGSSVELTSCFSEDLRPYLPPYPWPAGIISTQAFVSGPAGVAAYLDMDNDGVFGENDAIRMHQVIGLDIASADSDLLNYNARQCDINGNAIGDLYDAGRMDALVRPARSITSGPDGICNSNALGDDLEAIPGGLGEPGAVVIRPGPDYILHTLPLGDDVLSGNQILAGPNGVAQSVAWGDVQVIPVGQGGDVDAICITGGSNLLLDSTAKGDDVVEAAWRRITAGPNGVCESSVGGDDVQAMAVGRGTPNTAVIDAGLDSILQTSPLGDDSISGFQILSGQDGIAQTPAAGDVQVIPLGHGQPQSVCILPGENQVINSPVWGDDALVEDPKDSVSMFSSYPQNGRPTSLIPITPAQNPLYLDQMVPVPITVAVRDSNGRPKSGVSPTFTVSVGAGFFDDGVSGGTNILSNVQADQWGEKESAPRGWATAVFFPGPGYNQVMVSLPSDSTKGVPPVPPISFGIQVLNQGDVHPNSMTIFANPTMVNVGSTVNLLITVKDGSLGVHGLANRIKMLSQRNIYRGFDPSQFGEERWTSIFHDNFETGTLSGGSFGPWSISAGGGTMMVNTSSAGLFGQYALMVTDGDSQTPVLWRMINVSGNQDLHFSYQWAFVRNVSAPNFNVHFITEYSLNGTDWRRIKDVTGSGLMGGIGFWMNERFSLKALDTEGGGGMLFIRFVFDVGNGVTDPQTIYLDNVNVEANQIEFQEGFEGYNVGQYPTTFNYAVFINTGRDGLLQTPVTGDDQALFNEGSGQAFAAIIYPGPNAVRDSTPSGDDLNGSGQTINAGPNGKAETTAQGDDFQAIPVGQGLSFSMAVLPGADLVLGSSVRGDDEVVGSIGRNPGVAVDNSIWPMTGNGQGNKGSNNFLFIGRVLAGNTVEDYSATLTENLSGADQVILTFYSLTSSQVDFIGPTATRAQEFAVEVSDNGGKSWVKVWDNAGQEDLTWTKHEIRLYNDGRFNLEDDFLIRWRASMDGAEDGILDHDAVYIDDVSINAIQPAVDFFGPVIDTMDGQGHYTTTFSTLQPGNTIRISAFYWPFTISAGENNLPLYSYPDAVINVQLRKIEQGSIKVLPDNFTLKACQTLKMTVVGRYLDMPPGQVTDLTRFFKLIVNGPAREIRNGLIQADCFTGTVPPQFSINAVPRIPGVYDPGGGGGGEQTGDISGVIYKPSYATANNAPLVLNLSGGQKIYSHASSNGIHFFPGVPVGSGYSLDASLQSYTKKVKTGITVTAGNNTTASFAILSGADFDGDATSDSSDTDKDGDGSTDSTEATEGSSNYDWDTDGDGVSDNLDAFPAGSGESLDTDGDQIGNNADTDDDNDNILDTEEVVAGSDGYITDPLLWDTDGGGENDGHETANSRNPTNPAGDVPETDGDGDGIINVYETNTGTYVDPQHTGSNPAVADTDGDGLNDNLEVNTHHTNPNLADSDADGLGDALEVGWCTGATVADTDGDGLSDGAEDANHNGAVNSGETSPCDSDSDDDAIPDDYEKSRGLNALVNDAAGDLDGDGLTNLAEYTLGTYADDWDTDNDALPDGHEQTNASRSPNPLNPLSASDAASDFDSDGNSNLNEYWNGTDPWIANHVGGPGCFYWGDAGAGDGIVSPGDVIELKKAIVSSIPNYSGVLPNNGETQELDMDGYISPGDLIILQKMVVAAAIPILGSRPTSFGVMESPGATVSVGATCHVKVKLNNTAGKYTPGFGVVFEVDASSHGTATILGGDGKDLSNKRYDISGTQAQSGSSRIVLRIDTAGTIYVKAKIPQCGAGGTGRYCAEVVINPLIQIKTQ